MKTIAFAVLVAIGVWLFGSSKVVAQDTTSEPAAAAGSSADAFSDQQLALLRKDIRSIKKHRCEFDSHR